MNRRTCLLVLVVAGMEVVKPSLRSTSHEPVTLSFVPGILFAATSPKVQS